MTCRGVGKPNLKIACVEFLDDGPDDLGRRHYALTWWSESAPIQSTEPGRGHICTGYGLGIRGQHFHANPDRLALRIV